MLIEKNLLIVHFNDIREILIPIKKLWLRNNDRAEIIYPDDSMEMVMNKFEQTKKTFYQLFKEKYWFYF
jgi:CIC family chloride channel protein